eukprot:COSAG05_NODE_848_length_6985_cov_11.108336_1_plen_378_part_00
MSVEMQHMIRMNAQRMQDTMAGLADWEKDIAEKDAKFGGAGSGKRGSKAKPKPRGAAPPVRGSSAGAPAPAPIRKPAAEPRKDWKSGDMQDYYKKWEGFDEDEAEKASHVVDENAPVPKPAKIQTKLGPAGIASNAAIDKAAIPKAQPMPTSSFVNQDPALDDPTIEAGNKEKDKGNRLYLEQRYGESVAAYTRGLDVLYGKAAQDCPAVAALQSLKSVLYSNRAMAHLKLQNWDLADADASSCLDLDPTAVKGYLRRGVAQREQHRYADAVRNFEKVLQLDPNSKDGIKQLGKAIELTKKFGSSLAPASSSSSSSFSSGGGKKKKSAGFALAFEKKSKQKQRDEEKPWRVAIPIREMEGTAPGSEHSAAQVRKPHR